ncbi:MAG: protein-export chaperone SecB [Dissulfurispiraceae bacterium]
MELRFSIIDIKQVESHFTLNTDFKPTKDEGIEISYGTVISYEKKDKLVSVALSIISDNKKQPFIFTIRTVGLFNFPQIPASKELDRIVNINCGSIIFPYIRESIADLTRRAGFPPLHINPINFIALYEEKQKKQSNIPPAKSRKASKS